MIFKLQRSLRSPGGPRALIYNQDRSILGEVPLTGPLMQYLRGRLKVYVHANWSRRTGIIHIDNEAPAQDW